MCSEAQQNYDREIQLHASSLNTISKLKEDLAQKSIALRDTTEKHEQLLQTHTINQVSKFSRRKQCLHKQFSQDYILSCRPLGMRKRNPW